MAAASMNACGGSPEPREPDLGWGPSPGLVSDGLGADTEMQVTARSIFANWTGFGVETASPLTYQWAIGTAPLSRDVREWEFVGGSSSATVNDLTLESGATYYVSVRAMNSEGRFGKAASSNGVRVIGEGGNPYPHPAASEANPETRPTQPGIRPGNPPKVVANTGTGTLTPAVPSGIGSASDPARPTGTTQDPPSLAAVSQVGSASQFGITWQFAGAAPCGQFVNGDWWVIGPVSITRITPESRKQGPRIMHGSMIDPDPQVKLQGYDNAMYGAKDHEPESSRYDASRNVALGISADSPLELRPGQSLVSTTSVEEPGRTPQLHTAAVLTCLATVPARGSFRPPYASTGEAKRVRYNASQIDLAILPRLATPKNTPSMALVTKAFERPWIDHVPTWIGRFIHPAENMPDYGRDLANQVSIGGVMVLLDFPGEVRRPLVERLVQLGIDNAGVVRGGGKFVADGGHSSGRKFPILFAAKMLDDPSLLDVLALPHAAFGEDQQTFFVEETSPGMINGGHGGYTMDDVGLAEWGNRHAYRPSADNKEWESDSYRRCCTANSWVGQILAARALDLQTAWDHPALFAYMDRFMSIEPKGEWTRSWSKFPEAMWERYRSQVK